TEASFELEGRFHILTLVEGESVKLVSNGNEFVLNYSETVVVPASTGRYTMRAGGEGKCMVVKALLK
ncbi:MAG: class I mannose-6-phosphate isomerase, partial [Kosmotogaceae bacterium]